MTGSLRAFFTDVIDYAGMFPPASLSLKESLANYVRYLQSTEAWMLGRFVCPASRVRDLTALAEWSEMAKGRLSLTSPADLDDPQQLAGLESDLESARTLATTGVSISLEIKLPQRPITDLIKRARDFCDDVFLEVPLESQIDVEKLLAKSELKLDDRWSLKFRTGGITPVSFPSPTPLAHAITVCRDAGVRWKATAGLHHPLRHFDEGVGTHDTRFPERDWCSGARPCA